MQTGLKLKRITLIKRSMVRPTGLEPVTYGLEIRCSIQLSYGRVYTEKKCWQKKWSGWSDLN